MAFHRYRGYSSVANRGVNTVLTDADLVEQDLRNAFMIKLGDCVGRPYEGRIIHDLLFDLQDSRTETLVYADAQRIIANDPRVKALETLVTISPDTHWIRLDIKLFYVEFNMIDWFSVTF